MPSAALAAGAESTRPLLVGGDPEVFLKDRATGRVTVSCGKIGGKKGTGVPVGNKRTGTGLRILEDNVTVELNFNAVTDHYSWADSMSIMYSELTVHLHRKGLDPYPTASHTFSATDLGMPEAHVFGCEPDYDAYDITDSKRIINPMLMGNDRYCGGHVHLGFNNPAKLPSSAVAILCDMFLGLPSISHDPQAGRRKYYGKAGLYRPKSYGLEYRTMSNWWLRPENASASVQMCREAFEIMKVVDRNVDGLYALFDKMPLKDVKVVIDQESVKQAREVWLQARSYAIEAGMPLGACFYPRNL